MNILRNAGKHEILHITENPLQIIERCGRVAYQSQDKITPDSAEKFVRMLLSKGHESVLEHATMTVRFDNCSRGFTHELVRHRLMSITQESTRYVDESDFNVVVPPHVPCEALNYPALIDEKENVSLKRYFEIGEMIYRQLRKNGIAAQDARQILPIAIKSQIVCTTNFREWRHILKIRTAKNAHWEIRRIMSQLVWDLQTRVPVVFSDIHPEFTEREAKDWGWICSQCKKTPKDRPFFFEDCNICLCWECAEAKPIDGLI